MARTAKGELGLSHPYNVQALDAHLVDGCGYRCVSSFLLNGREIPQPLYLGWQLSAGSLSQRPF